MEVQAPRINLIFYKHLADHALYDYFSNGKWTEEDGRFVHIDNRTASSIREEIENLILEKLMSVVSPWDISNPSRYLVIGACRPSDNFLLDLQSGWMVKDNTMKLVKGKYPVRYIFREREITDDLVKVNGMLEDIFVKYFDKANLLKRIGQEYGNVMFIRHRRLDCYMMFKLIKYIFGAANCVNLFSKRGIRNNRVILSVNEMIDNDLDKRSIKGSIQLSMITKEVRQYLNECLKSV